MINRALRDTKKFFEVTDGKGWLDEFYQYANRLAHLYFLREICRVDAKLIFVYFCDDSTHISTSINEWRVALTDQQSTMGLHYIDHISELFINCQELQ